MVPFKLIAGKNVQKEIKWVDKYVQIRSINQFVR